MGLMDAIRAAEAKALAQGALLTIRNEQMAAEEDGLPYSISWTSTQSAKDIAAVFAKSTGQANFNPFLPHEDALFVCNFGPSHKILLNKFQMEQGHVLAVTKSFEEQQALLSDDDAGVITALLKESDGLVMFNGGRDAGGSQDHHHIHFLPHGGTPLGPILDEIARNGKEDCLNFFAFRHAFVGFAPEWQDDKNASGILSSTLARCYSACRIEQAGAACNLPYDIVMTRRWLLMVPRSKAVFMIGDIAVPVNALHYAGRIGVRQKSDMNAVRDTGMLAILQACSAG